jgi:leucyl-tRNA synthetase
MTDEVWDYVLGDGAFPSSSSSSESKFAQLKREFQYFYPMDVRSSGKDLIPNHLSFCVYVHAALFPEHHWPKSMRANGHLMLNGKKMAKSTGNSLTLKEAVKKFGADATRLTLADSGDGIEVRRAISFSLLVECDCCFSRFARLSDGPIRFFSLHRTPTSRSSPPTLPSNVCTLNSSSSTFVFFVALLSSAPN